MYGFELARSTLDFPYLHAVYGTVECDSTLDDIAFTMACTMLRQTSSMECCIAESASSFSRRSSVSVAMEESLGNSRGSNDVALRNDMHSSLRYSTCNCKACTDII